MYAFGRFPLPPTSRFDQASLHMIELQVHDRRAWSGPRLVSLIDDAARRDPRASSSFLRELEAQVGTRRLWKSTTLSALIEQIEEHGLGDTTVYEALTHELVNEGI